MLLANPSFTVNRRKYGLCEVMYDRLDAIRSDNIQDPQEAVEGLTEDGLVSDFYVMECAEVDLWYVHGRKNTLWRSAESIFDSASSPESALMLAVIIDALRDVRIQRPCDVGVWRVDYPPGNRKWRCTPNDHICAVEARKYIQAIDEELESALNLSTGFLKSLL